MAYEKNGAFFARMNRLSDLTVLGVLWFVTSLPVITLGASSTALYYAAAKTIRYEKGSPAREFFRSFRRNLFQGCSATAVYLLLYASLGTAAWLSGGQKAVFAGLLPAAAVLMAASLYLFPVLSRFTMPLYQYFTVSLFLSVRYFAKTALLVVTFCLCAVVFCIFPFLLPVIAASFAYYATYILEDIFREYMNVPDENKGEWYV